MPQINVSVVRADTNAAFDVDLPDDASIQELLGELIKSLGLPRLGPNGDVVAYEVSNKRTGDGLRDGTLGARGVKTGDVLLLTSSFVAGECDRASCRDPHCRTCGCDNPQCQSCR